MPLRGCEIIDSIKAKVKSQRINLALVSGAFPLLPGFLLMFVIVGSEYRNAGWDDYLIQHRVDIYQSLIVSSLMIAVLSTLLGNKLAILAAGLQPGLIQLMLLFTNGLRSVEQNLLPGVIVMFPMLILFIALKGDMTHAGSWKE